MKFFRFLIGSLVCGLWSGRLYACSVCFGDPNTLQSKALTWAVGFLLLVIGGVLVAIAGLAVKWSRRAKKLSQDAGILSAS